GRWHGRQRRPLSSSHLLLFCRKQALEQWITPPRRFKARDSRWSQLVILAWGALLRVRNGLPLPLRPDQPIALQPPHRRIHRPAGQTDGFHDAEAIQIAGMDRLQDHCRGMRELRLRSHGEIIPYVESYLTKEFSRVMLNATLGQPGGLPCSSCNTFFAVFAAFQPSKTSAFRWLRA